MLGLRKESGRSIRAMREPQRNTVFDGILTALEPWVRAIIREENAKLSQSGNEGKKASEAVRLYFTVKEAADFSRLGCSTIRLYIRKRELKAHQVGSRVIIKRTDLEKFLEAHRVEALAD